MRTILVVDDMPIIRDPIAAMLGAAGYRALCAGNGSDALAVLRSRGADLILLDVTMPGMDGLTFLGHLRSDPATAKIPVIMLSGEEDREDIVRAGKLGIQGYVLKSSFSLKDLLYRVRNQMQIRSSAAGASSRTSHKSDRPVTWTAPVAAAAAASRGTNAAAQPDAPPAVVAGVRPDSPVPSQILTREV